MTPFESQRLSQAGSVMTVSMRVMGAAVRATWRHLIHGPRRQGWSWLYEFLAAIMGAELTSAEEANVIPARRAMDQARKAPLPAGVTVTRADYCGCSGEWIRTQNGRTDGVLLYLHGGAYIFGSSSSHRFLIAELAQATRLPALAIDYRLAPEHPFPAALIDAYAVYWQLLTSEIPPSKIVIGGDSAGGGLTLALLLALRDAGLPLPAAAFCLSPWADMVLTGRSLLSNHPYDYLDLAAMRRAVPLITGNTSPQHWALSPLFADLHGLPPLLIQAGTVEMLYDDAARLAQRASAAGVQVTFEPWENMIHVWHFMFPFEPDARDAIVSVGRFVRQQLMAEEAVESPAKIHQRTDSSRLEASYGVQSAEKAGLLH